MKVERWEEESDEDWAERLEEEIELANATETTQYFVERDPYVEENFIINYIGETGWTWKEHPEGAFSCKQVLEWKKKAEILPIYEKQYSHMIEHALELEDKLEAIKKLTEPFIEWGGPFNKSYRVRLHKHPELQKYVSELMEILEGEEVQSSDTTAKKEDE